MSDSSPQPVSTAPDPNVSYRSFDFLEIPSRDFVAATKPETMGSIDPVSQDAEPEGTEVFGRPTEAVVVNVKPPGAFADTVEEIELEDDLKARLSALRNLENEFYVYRLIGRGGQGEVREAMQVNLGRTVALKKCRPQAMAQRHFFEEVIATAQLDHPNIVPVYDVGVLEDKGKRVPALTMKRVQGVSWLHQLYFDRDATEMKKDQFLAKHLGILVQVINAVAYAHSKGIIHRDLKPSQVIVGDFGEVFLLDWGLAVYVGARPSSSADHRDEVKPPEGISTRETAHNPAGTPTYMAPEQSEGTPEHLGIHTDVYLVGAMLFEVLAGEPPHPGDTLSKVLDAVRENVVKPLPEGIDEELYTLTKWCMESDPELRPPTVMAVKLELEQFLSGANKKKESIRITDEVLAGDVPDDYDRLSGQGRQLDQARQLWPENPAIHGARNRVLKGFVAAALQRGDFLLAQLQANRVEDATVAEKLRGDVERAKAEAEIALPQPPLYTPGRIVALLLSWVIIAAAVWGVVYFAKDSVIAEMRSSARSLAELAAGDLKPKDLRAVLERPEIQTAPFLRAMNALNALRRANLDVRYIYTMRPRFEDGPSMWTTVVDADPVDFDYNRDGVIQDTEAGSPPGSDYNDGTEEMRIAWEQGRSTTGFVNDPWGNFISAFTPVIDRDTGEILAIVGVDLEYSATLRKISTVRSVGILAAMTLIVLASLTFDSTLRARRSLRRVRQLEADMQKQSSMTQGRALHLG